MFPLLFDSHCHIHFNAYRSDMNEAIQQSLAKGVLMLTVGTQKDTSKNGLEVASRFDGLWASVGLHPNHITEQTFWDDDELPPEAQATPIIKTRSETFDPVYYRELAKHPQCVAIGECGLDYYRLPENINREEMIEQQKKAVRLQFDLADELNLPVIIHCRDAHADQLAILKEYSGENKLARRGVVHCFTGTLLEAQAYLDIGFFISFTGIITFPPKKSDILVDGMTALQQVIRALPIEALLIETDAPYLTPVPYRGQRNEPMYVEWVARKLAEIKQLSFEEIAKITTDNAKKLFGISAVAEAMADK